MSTLKDILGKNPLKGDLGIEIEAESTIENFPNPSSGSVWQVKGDGSLRYIGVEYVTNGPISFGELESKIEEIIQTMSSGKWIENSPRTSIHVHCSVLNHTAIQVYNALVLYWLIENVLFKMCGKGREGNLFCLRLRDASGILDIIRDDIEKNYGFYSFRGDYFRYGGVNCNAIYKFGSLEYRGMAGIYDKDLIVDWSTILHLLTQGGKLFKNPEELIEKFFTEGYEKFFSDILGEKLFARITKDLTKEQLRDLIDTNIELLSTLIYDTDWEVFEKNIKTKPKRAKSSSTAEQALNAVRGNRANIIAMDDFGPNIALED